MNEDLKFVLQLISFVFIGFIILGGFIVGIEYAIFNLKYSGKSLVCIEDKGAEFIATIAPGLINSLLYFEKSSSGIEFRGTDNKIYKCRGIVKISERNLE